MSIASRSQDRLLMILLGIASITGRGENSFYESGAAPAEDVGVPVSKMEELIEAYIAILTWRHPIEYPPCPSDSTPCTLLFLIPSLSAWGESPYPSAYSDDKQCRERDYEGTGGAREEPGFLCFVLAFSTTESLNGAWSIATGNL